MSSVALAAAGTAIAGCHTSTTAGYNTWNMELTTMTLKVQYLSKLEDGTQIQAGWYVTTPFCPGVVFATEQWGHRGATPGANGPSAGDELR